MVVPREETQRKLALVSAKTLAHTPSQTYTVADRLEERARELPDKAFLRFEGRTASFGASNAFANRLAHAARELGLARGDVAALSMDNRPEYVQTWAGPAKLGVTVALLNPSVRGRALEHALEAVGARPSSLDACRCRRISRRWPGRDGTLPPRPLARSPRRRAHPAAPPCASLAR